MRIRSFLVSAAACAAALAAALPLCAQEYPGRPIKLVVPFAPGGSTDLAARLVAEHAGRELGQTIVVENRAGAGGSVGMEYMARAAPDGYTLGMATVSTHGSNPAIHGGKLRYDPVKDFEPVTTVAATPGVLAVHSGVPARTLQEFVALARANPKTYSYASPGMGSLGHANVEHFCSLARIELVHVPYKGASSAMNDVLAGQVHIITDLPTAMPHIRSGKLRALAVLAERRWHTLPDVPTYAELGYPQMGEGGWFGVVAPAKTAPAIVAKLNKAIHRAMEDPAFRAKLDESGATPVPNTPAEFARQIQATLERYQRIVQATNIRAE